MTDFEEKKEEYLKTSFSRIERIELLSTKKNAQGNVKYFVYSIPSDKVKKIILDPKNEKELILAESTLTLGEILNDLLWNPEEINIEGCMIIQIYIQLMNALKEEDQNAISRIKNYLNHIDPENSAKIIYELISIVNYDPYEILDYIQSQTGFTDESYYDFVSLLNYSITLVSQESTTQLNYKKMTPDNPEEVAYFLQFSDSFQKIYLENKLVHQLQKVLQQKKSQE